MKYFIFSIALFISLTSLCRSQTAKEANEPPTDPTKELLQILSPGSHIVNIITAKGPTISPREKELSDKVIKAMQQNPVWFKDSLTTASPASFQEKLGLTKEEFDEYMNIENSKPAFPEITFLGKDTLEIIRTGNLLSFRGSGRLKGMDSLRIDLSGNEAIYRGHQLPYLGRIKSKDANNPFKSEFSGYEYSFREDPPDAASLQNLNNLSMTLYALQLGQLTDSRQTFLNFTAIQYIKGNHTLNISIPCLFE